MDNSGSRNQPRPTPATTGTGGEETNSRYRLDGEYAAVPNTEEKGNQLAEESKQPAAPMPSHETGPHIVERTLFDQTDSKLQKTKETSSNTKLITAASNRTQLISTGNNKDES